jgi:hypothetical protein
MRRLGRLWKRAGGAMAAAVMAGLAGVQAQGPAHPWDYPFCGAQPAINAVYDHEYPTYSQEPNGPSNGVIRLYNDTVDNRRAYEGHNGWDYATRGASGVNGKRSVHAVGDGVVTYAGWQHPGDPTLAACADQVASHRSGYGLMLRVRHGDREALYGHLAAIHLEAGAGVARGQVIGTSGSTGASTGPHLHFGAFEPAGPALWQSLDPYGWNADWQGLHDLPLDERTDPWFRRSGRRSVRLILPAARDNEPCPPACGPWVVVDDLDPPPDFRLGCRAGAACPGWVGVGSLGYRGHVFITHPNGETTDDWAQWTASRLPPGRYEVEAYVPLAPDLADVHAARYRIAGREVVVDQHAEGDVWVGLGVYDFDGPPSVTLVDAGFIRHNWSDAGPCRTLAADAVRFRPLCAPGSGPGAAPPVVPAPTPTGDPGGSGEE